MQRDAGRQHDHAKPAAAPSAATGTSALRPNVMTMKTTSRPSSSTPLKVTTKANQSRPATALVAGPLRSLDLLAVGRVLVVQRLQPGRAEDRLAPPLQPEDQQSVPTTSCSRLSGNQRDERVAGGVVTPVNATSAAAMPASADLQPRVAPIASTIVNASTNSTAEARKVETMRPQLGAGHAAILASIPGGRRVTGTAVPVGRLDAMALAGQLGRLAEQSAVYGLGSLAARVASVLLLPLYTRTAAPTDYGQVELVLALVLAVSVIAKLGLINAFFRFFFDDDPQRRREVFATVMWGSAASPPSPPAADRARRADRAPAVRQRRRQRREPRPHRRPRGGSASSTSC